MAKAREKSLPRKVMTGTSRAGIGGGAILIGIALFLMFRGFGPGGTGLSGSGTGQSSAGKAMITKDGGTPPSSETSDNPLTVPETKAGGLTDDEKKALSGEILTVLIDEHEFLMGIPASTDPVYRPVPLKRLVELAEMARGDSNGIKVRILRRETARAVSEQELLLELQHAGIRKDSIIMPGSFVP